MTTGHAITRRALLAAAPSAVAIVAVLPSVTGHASAVEREPSRLEALIEAHRASYARLNAALEREQDVLALARPFWPRVRIGRILSLDGKESPNWAYSLDEIRAASRGWQKVAFSPAQAEAYRIKFLGFEREYGDLRARYDSVLQEHDFAAVESDREEAGVAEEKARIALVLHRPENLAQAEQKADYVAASVPFVEGYCLEEEFIEALLAEAGKVLQS